MKIIKETSPYIHKRSSVKRMMIDVLIALIPVVVFSIVQFGLDSLWVILISCATMLISEIVFVYLTNQDPYDGTKKKFKEKVVTAYKKASINNITAPLISAIIFAMIMPAGSNWYIVVVGALSGIVIGKLVFGGLGANIFNPAALGRVIVMVCFGSDLQYSSVVGIGGSAVDVVASGTPLGALAESLTNINIYSIKDLFIGTVSGSMGEISKVCIIIGGIYLLVRKSADFRPMLVMIASFMILMFVAGLSLETNALNFMLYQTLAGGLLFGAIFMITDPVTSPVTRPGRITFGLIVGVVSALIRLIGAYPEGVAFAILIANMLVPVIDYYKFSTNKYNYKHAILWSLIMILSSVIIIFAL